MAYTYKEAVKTAFKYLNIDESKAELIENTNGRGIVYDFDGSKTVIFVYPISCKQNNKQNFFDTRDSGAKERAAAWKYAKENGLRYFCLGFNEKQDRYKEYVLSLESDESSISDISFRTSLASVTATGTQVNIPNDFIPSKKFERIKTPKGFYISAVKKDYIGDYIRFFDNRPYMIRTDLDITEPEEDNELVYNTNIQTEYEKNRIVFGAPGTGKSFALKKDCEEAHENYGAEFERVTLHPDYTYSQFVGAYKPVMDDDGEKIKYDYVPGPFIRVFAEALRNARTNEPKPYILLIEEINRAKVSAVFGDVFQLLDRDEDGVSEYEIQASEDIRRYLAKPDVLGGNPDNYRRLRLPDNMYIWATMNSADQGVFPMDTAFKRRWDFEYLGINDNEEKIQGKCLVDIPGCDEKIEWNILRKAINDKLSSNDFKVNEDKLMGPFFIAKKIIDESDSGKFIKIFKSKIIMYLYEDAVKQGRNRFFGGCPDTSKYSAICEFFTTNGLEIFGRDFKSTYYDKYKG